MEKRDNRQFFVNILASILAFIVNAGIQFFVTPILTKNVGDEAYSFITIANDFTSFAGIFASILNSVAARFISVEFYKKNKDKAEQYYSSIFIGNIIISIILAILACVFILSYTHILNVSKELIPDVTVIFIITFANYILSVLISIFTVSTYVKNRIDIASSRNIASYIIKLLVIILLFVFMPEVKVYYIALATFFSTVFLGISNSYVAKKIMPEIRLNVKSFSPKLIVELLKTGIWMSINNLSNVLANNLTTVIINLYISANRAGFYSVALTIPNCVNTFAYAVYNVFVPTYVRLYAEGKKDELIQYCKFSMNIMSFLLCVPFIVLCIVSKDFLNLWQSYRSDLEINEMAIIMSLAVTLVIIYTPLLPLSQLGLTANKVKVQMVNNIFVSFTSLVVVMLGIKVLNWDLIGIPLATLIVQGFKWIFFTPIYAAWVIGAKKVTFFRSNIKIVIAESIIFIVMYFMHKLFNIKGWVELIICIGFLSVLGYIMMFIIIFPKSQKKRFINGIKRLGGKL